MSLARPSIVLSATLPVNPSVTTTSTVAVEDVVALDESEVVHAARADQLVRLLHELVALGFFLADVEQADARSSRCRTRRARRWNPWSRTARAAARVALELAPRSSMCVWPPLRAGTDDMMGARSTGPTVLSTKCAIAVSAPVLPALTIAAARPSFTRSMASRMEESLRRRMASRGCSDMPTTLAAGCTLDARAQRGRRARERGLDDLGLPDEDELEGRIGGERAQRRRGRIPAHRGHHSSRRRR